MGRLLTGDEGFKYTYRSVRRDLPLEDLARVARAGDLRFVVDHYSVHFEGGKQSLVFLEKLGRVLGLPPDDDRGFYEAEDHDVTAEALFGELVLREREVTVPRWQERYPGREVTQLDVFAHVQYRVYRDTDWAPLLAYVNGKLPEGAELRIEEIKGLSSELLAEFDPELHEPNREDGTGFLMWFLEEEEDRCLPYLAFRILVHAVTHDLEMLDIDGEPTWRKQLFPALDGPPGKPAPAPKAKAQKKPAPERKAKAQKKPAAAAGKGTKEPAAGAEKATKEPAAEAKKGAKKPAAEAGKARTTPRAGAETKR